MNVKKAKTGVFCILFFPLVFMLASVSLTGMVSLNKAFAYAYHEACSTLQTSSSGATELLLETPRNIGGEIRIRTWDKDKVLVEYEKKGKANTKEEAQKFVELIKLDLDRSEEVIILDVATPRQAPWQGTDKSARLYLNIFVPEGFSLRSETFNFDLHVSGPLGNVEIESDYGTIYLTGVQGDTEISTSYGRIEAEDLSGRVNIETSYAPIYLSQVDTQGKTVFLETAYDKIDMSKVRGNIKARTNYSSILGTDLELVEGKSSFETVYNKIDLQIKELKDCDLFIYNTYGNVCLGIPPTVSAEVSFSIDPGGKIETLGLPILIESIDQTSLDGVLGEGESKIEVEISGIGKILLESY